MEDNNNPQPGQLEPEKARNKPGSIFAKGHPRFGGRKKGSVNKRTKHARDLAAEMGADPIEFLLRIMTSESIEVAMVDEKGKTVLDFNGKPVLVHEAIPLAMKIDAAKNVAPYVRPKLQSTQITGAEDGPVQVQLPTAEILANDKISDAMQDLALLVASQQDADEQHVN